MRDDPANLTTLLSDEEWIALIEGQPLPAARALEVRAILHKHPQLAELAAQMQADREALSVIDVQRRSGSAEIMPPADLAERIEQTLEREALVGLATIEAKSPPPAELPRYVPAEKPRRGPAVPARWIGPLGLAASLLVAAGGAVLIWQSTTPRTVQPLLTKTDQTGGTQGTMQIAVNDQQPEQFRAGAPAGDTQIREPATMISTLAAGPSPVDATGATPNSGPGTGGEVQAPQVTIAAKESSRQEPQRASSEEIAIRAAAPAGGVQVASAEVVSDEALLAAALQGRLVAVVMPSSTQRRLDIDTRLIKMAEQPAAAAPVQRISVSMMELGQQQAAAMNSITLQIALADGFEFLPADVRSRLNLAASQQTPEATPGPIDGPVPAVTQAGSGVRSGDSSAPPAPAPTALPTGSIPAAGASALQLTMPRLARATTPATAAGIALLQRSLTGSADEVRLVILPAAAEGDDPAKVWLRSAGIAEPVMQPWDHSEIMWWTAPTAQITRRVVVPVLVAPGK